MSCESEVHEKLAAVNKQSELLPSSFRNKLQNTYYSGCERFIIYFTQK